MFLNIIKSILLKWDGLGFIVPIIIVTVSLLLQLLCELLTDNPDYYFQTRYSNLALFGISGAICLLANHFLNKLPGKVEVDTENNKIYVTKRTHTFYNISLKNWGFILPVIGLALTLFNINF